MVLNKIRPSKTVARGNQQPIQMVPSIFMIRRGCVCQWSWKSQVNQVTDASLKRLFTDTDMHNSDMREEMEDFYNWLQLFIQNNQLSIPSNDYDLVLDIMPTADNRISWSYYYACHEARCLFWLEEYDASYMISELSGVKSPTHVSALHLSHSQFPTVSANVPVVCRASFGGPLLVGRQFRTGLVSSLMI